MKNINCLKTITSILAIGFSASTLANTNDLTIAIIKDSTASKTIISGELDKSISKLKLVKSTHNNFEKNLALCAAYIKKSSHIKAEHSCSKAIDYANSFDSANSKTAYLRSMSFNNRAIARYLYGDLDSAMADLSTAMSIDANNIVKANYHVISNVAPEEDNIMESAMSD